MAQQDYTSLIVLAGAGALAYYGYQQGWFSSLFPAAVAPTPLPTGTAAGNAPAPAINCPAPGIIVNGVCTQPVATSNPPAQQITTPPAPSASGLSTSGALAAFALASQAATEGLPNASNATLNADQWNYYYGHVPQFLPSVNGASVNAGSLFDLDQVFFPNGRPANNANYTQYTAAQFIAALQNAGTSWSGLSGVSGFYPGIPVGAIHHGRFA